MKKKALVALLLAVVLVLTVALAACQQEKGCASLRSHFPGNGSPVSRVFSILFPDLCFLGEELREICHIFLRQNFCLPSVIDKKSEGKMLYSPCSTGALAAKAHYGAGLPRQGRRPLLTRKRRFTDSASQVIRRVPVLKELVIV